MRLFRGCAAIEDSITCNRVLIMIMILIRQEEDKQITQPCYFSVYLEPHMNISLVLNPRLCVLGTLTPIFFKCV